jgi:hypothetical protein
MTDEVNNQKLINQMVTELMAVPKGEASQGDVIIAFCKAVALLAHMIGEMRGGEGGEEVLEDMFDLIEGYFESQTVIVTEEYYEH